MSDRYFTGPYTSAYESTREYENQYTKTGGEPNNVDIKQSNISQQTIIHKARLYSPDKSQQLLRNNFNQSQANDRTKTKKQLGSKIQGIVGLVQGDRDASIQQFKDVVVAEKNILGRMHQQNTQPRYVPNIDFSQIESNHDRATTFGPIRNQNYNIPHIQSKQGTQRETYNTQKPVGFRDNIYKKSAIDDLKTDRNVEEAAAQHAASQPSRPFDRPPAGLSDDTYVIIEEIERKAMDQIETLRKDKIELMRRLNEEIRAHNEEKKLRIKLENQLARLKGGLKAQNQKSFQELNKPSQAQQKSYSQPHFNQNQSQTNYNQAQPYFNQTQKTIPSQTYYPPYQPDQQIISPIPRKATEPDQHQAVYERQFGKLNQQNVYPNRNFATNPKPAARNSEKQSLRAQIAALNQKIRHYQAEIQMNRNKRGSDVPELQALLQQGQRIKAQTRRLLALHEVDGQNQHMYATNKDFLRRDTSNEAIQKMNNFQRRLVEFEEENERLKQNVSKGVRKDYNQGLSRASLPVNNKVSRNSINTKNNQRMWEFEQILGDLKSAIR